MAVTRTRFVPVKIEKRIYLWVNSQGLGYGLSTEKKGEKAIKK